MPLIRHYPPGVVQTSSGLVRAAPGGGFKDVAAAGGSTPTLSAATATSVTATSAVPQVTLTFA